MANPMRRPFWMLGEKRKRIIIVQLPNLVIWWCRLTTVVPLHLKVLHGDVQCSGALAPSLQKNRLKD